MVPGKTGKAMTLGERLKRLRWKLNWTQAQLAERLQTHQKQISGYERDVHTPSTDTLIRYAKVFDCSLDYLVFDDRPSTKLERGIADWELLVSMRAIDRLPESEKRTVKAILDAFIIKDKFLRLARGEKDEDAEGERLPGTDWLGLSGGL